MTIRIGNYDLRDTSGSYSWIVEFCDPRDYKDISHQEIVDWIEVHADNARDEADRVITQALEELRFPRTHYSSQLLSRDEWEEAEREMAEREIAASAEEAVEFVEWWITWNNRTRFSRESAIKAVENGTVIVAEGQRDDYWFSVQKGDGCFVVSRKYGFSPYSSTLHETASSAVDEFIEHTLFDEAYDLSEFPDE
jgi:hypothetical protein